MTRRQALRNVAAGAGGLLAAQTAAAQADLRLAGRPIEIALTSISPLTVRIAIQPIENGQPVPIASDGALVKEDWGPPAARLRSLAAPRTVKCGELMVALSADATALTVRVQTK